MPSASPLTLDPDRLLPTDAAVRPLARSLYEGVRGLPIISPHGHVPAQWLAEDTPFTDPTSLLITPDHYVNRLLHAHGVPLSELGVGRGPLDRAGRPRGVPRRCARTGRSTAALRSASGSTPSCTTSSACGCGRAPRRRTPSTTRWRRRSPHQRFRPRALYRRFGIEVLATTDDPCDDLAAHEYLRDDPTWTGRVVPTFRPDRYLEPSSPTWNADADRLAEVSGIDTGDYAGFLAAMANRRAYFKAHGAVSSDHSHADARTDVLAEARRPAALRPGAQGRHHRRRGHRPAAAPRFRDGPDGLR